MRKIELMASRQIKRRKKKNGGAKNRARGGGEKRCALGTDGSGKKGSWAQEGRPNEERKWGQGIVENEETPNSSFFQGGAGGREPVPTKKDPKTCTGPTKPGWKKSARGAPAAVTGKTKEKQEKGKGCLK